MIYLARGVVEVDGSLEVAILESERDAPPGGNSEEVSLDSLKVRV